MPTPKTGESRNEFIERCIPIVLDDGTAKDQKQAVAVCNSLFEQGEKAMDEDITAATEAAEEKEDETKTKMIAMSMGHAATSFADLEKMEEAAQQVGQMHDLAGKMAMLSENILMDDTVEDKAAALRDLANEFAGRVGQEPETEDKATWTRKYINDLPDSAFLYVEAGDKDGDGKTTPRSKRHFPYKDANSKVDLPHLRNAIARIPQSNAPGLTAEKKRSLQDKARKILKDQSKERGLFERIVDAVKNVVAPDEPKPATTGLMVWKEADGTYKWVARYSNNFRDEDNPPEIIAAKSHQRFAEMVDKGELPLPELWLWHVKEWKWGQAEWVAYDDAGFALAGGSVNKGFEPLAETIMELDPDMLRVSHGMPKNSIVRDADDPSVIVEHITREISPLPAWAAANNLTGFIIPKEVNMAIPEDKKQALQEEWGVTPDLLGSLEAANAADAKEAEEAGIEHKEKDEQGETAAPEETQDGPQEVTRTELGEVVAAIGEAMTTITAQINALAGEVKELKEHQAAEDEETLTDLFQRAIGHEQARVDGRKRLAKQGPKETPPETGQPAVVATGNPLVDNMVNSLVSGEWTNGFLEGQREVNQ